MISKKEDSYCHRYKRLFIESVPELKIFPKSA